MSRYKYNIVEHIPLMENGIQEYTVYGEWHGIFHYLLGNSLNFEGFQF